MQDDKTPKNSASYYLSRAVQEEIKRRATAVGRSESNYLEWTLRELFELAGAAQ